MLSLELPIELLVSIINTYLRSKYNCLKDLCDVEDLSYDDLCQKLIKHGYFYNETQNQIKNLD
jgi:hypothetical protein